MTDLKVELGDDLAIPKRGRTMAGVAFTILALVAAMFGAEFVGTVDEETGAVEISVELPPVTVEPEIPVAAEGSAEGSGHE